MKYGIGFATVIVIGQLNAATAAGMPPNPPRQNDNVRCVYPDPYVLLGRQLPGLEKVEYVFDYSPIGPIRWAFVSWDGPPDGMVFVIGCDGRAIAQIGLGHVERVHFYSNIDGSPVLEVLYVPDSGTNISDQSVALLRFNGRSIVNVWDHASNDVASASNQLFTGRAGDYRNRTETETYHWDYARDGSQIRVTGTHTVELGRKTWTRVLPTEKYCYSKDAEKFVACK